MSTGIGREARAARRLVGTGLALLLAGCGDDRGRPSAEVEAFASRPPAVHSEDSTSDRSGSPELTEPPDACALLTRNDAAEVLGAPVGSGRSADVSGLGNCAYRTETGEQVALIVQLGRDDSVDGTQLAMSFEYCGTRAVARPDGLGRAAALFESPAEPCGRGLTLWVATGLGFEGRTHPDLVRPVRGRIHLALSRDPPGDVEVTLPLLRDAAERVLARLTR